MQINFLGEKSVEWPPFEDEEETDTERDRNRNRERKREKERQREKEVGRKMKGESQEERYED